MTHGAMVGRSARVVAAVPHGHCKTTTFLAALRYLAHAGYLPPNRGTALDRLIRLFRRSRRSLVWPRISACPAGAAASASARAVSDPFVLEIKARSIRWLELARSSRRGSCHAAGAGSTAAC